MSEAPKKEDVLLALAPTESGDGVRVLRKRDERIELGEMRTAKEGKPIVGELVRLSQRPEHDRLFDVEVLATGPKPESDVARGGPAQVATDAYRENWERTFTGRGELN